VPSRAAVEQNAQLAVYQLALRLGAGADLATPEGAADRDAADSAAADDRNRAGRDSVAGGAELVYLRSGTPAVRQQPPLTEQDAQIWVHEAWPWRTVRASGVRCGRVARCSPPAGR
jgi:hypothetical protein